MFIDTYGRTVAAFVFMGMSACAQANELTLQEVIDEHTAARGGTAAIEALRSIEIRLNIVEPTFEVSGHYRAQRDNHMRIDIYADEQRVFTETLDGDSGWQMFADETVADLSAGGEQALRRGIVGNLYGLHELTDLGYDLALGPRTMVDGVSYITIKSTSPDGFEQQHFIDPESFLIVRAREESALHPDLNPEAQHFETVYADFFTVDEVVFNRHAEKRDLETGEVSQTVDVESLIPNVVIDPAVYVRPSN